MKVDGLTNDEVKSHLQVTNILSVPSVLVTVQISLQKKNMLRGIVFRLAAAHDGPRGRDTLVVHIGTCYKGAAN